MAEKPVKETVNRGITRYFAPDGKTEITEEEYKQKAWKKPAAAEEKRKEKLKED